MGGEIQAFGAQAAESLIQWWLEAGVDVAVGESPRGWLQAAGAPVPIPATQAKTL